MKNKNKLVFISTLIFLVMPFLTVHAQYQLPDFLNAGGDPTVVIGRIIKYLIGISGTLALGAFIYGGILWVISGGRDEYVTKGKSTMVYATIGLGVIFSSYVIITFIISAIGKA